MGVRYLKTFITKKVENGTFTVDVHSEIEKFKLRCPNTTPVIIIDLHMLHGNLYNNNHERLLGGRYNIFNERLYFILNKLKSLNARIVFYIDGPTQSDKTETNLQRRNDEYCDHVKILYAIDNGIDISGDLKGFYVRNLTPLTSNLKKIVKKSGFEFNISTFNECDEEMVHEANKLKALAIISDDTDFLIYEGNWKLWSAELFNFDTMQTIEYNKIALREKLALSSRQMILFGTLCGNDILSYEMVQGYHRYIAPRGGQFYKIANAIRYNIRTLPPTLSSRDENFIVQNVFEPENCRQGMRDLRNSINTYCCNNVKNVNKRKLNDKILQTFVENSENEFFAIRSGAYQTSINIFYFDLSKNIFKPFYDIIEPISTRSMGILLKDQQHLQPTRKFYFKMEHEKPYELVTFTPEYPPHDIPSILKLIYHPYDEDKQLDCLRLDLLCWLISSPKLNHNVILQLPSDNAVTIVTILYLHEMGEISIEEADCILLACNCNAEICNTLKYDDCKIIDGRDARLSFLFTKLFTSISKCFKIVGLRMFKRLLTFDGLYFHYLRKKCRQNSKECLNSYLKGYENLRIYST